MYLLDLSVAANLQGLSVTYVVYSSQIKSDRFSDFLCNMVVTLVI